MNQGLVGYLSLTQLSDQFHSTPLPISAIKRPDQYDFIPVLLLRSYRFDL